MTHSTISSESLFARTPPPPYYAVIFTSQLGEDSKGYAEMADRMLNLAKEEAGFLGAESARGTNGLGITVSYWKSEEAIAHWKAQDKHQQAQEKGRRIWYEDFQVRVAYVERAYSTADYKENQ